MRASQEIRVAIVEDDHSVCDGLGLIIGATPGFACVGTYYSAEDALPSLSSSEADVLLLDINLPGMSGSEAVSLFKAQHPSLQVLMLTIYDGQEWDPLESTCRHASLSIL